MNSQGCHETIYYGTGGHYLDWLKLSYRWFYAKWIVKEGRPVILGYGFADSEHEALTLIRSGDAKSMRPDHRHLKTMYLDIRSIQRDQDWHRKSRLRIFGVRNSPWRKVKPGWYIVQSRQQFPLYISAVHVKRFSAWLIHADVAENKQEVSQFVRRVNETHHIQLSEILSNGQLLN